MAPRARGLCATKPRIMAKTRNYSIMRKSDLAGLLAIATSLALSGASFEADSKRGASLFREQMCTNCHSIAGEGGRSAPDLSKRIDRNYTPAGIASLMWNHAPMMWSNLRSQGLTQPQLSEAQAADLFAYFYSTHYFERPGEAERGKALFTSKSCASCHALKTGQPTVGPPVSEWSALTDPTVLIQRMWEHAPQMSKAMEARHVQWPQLTSQDMADLLVYLQNLPETRDAKMAFEVPSPEGGEALFHSKGCANCHVNQKAFENLIGDSTLTDVAARNVEPCPINDEETGVRSGTGHRTGDEADFKLRVGTPVLFHQGRRRARQEGFRIAKMRELPWRKRRRRAGTRSQHWPVFGRAHGRDYLEARPGDGAAHAGEEDLLAAIIS